MGKKLILLLLLILIPLATAQDIAKTDNAIIITESVTSNYKFADNIEANITIKDPDRVVLVANQPMTYNSNDKIFNYTLNNTAVNKTGIYEACIFANNGTDFAEPKCFDIEVNKAGKKLDTAQGITQSVILVVIILIFGMSVWASIMISGKNRTDTFGDVIEVNWFKYVKYGLWGLSYMLFVFILFLSWNISFGFLDLGAIATAFEFLYRVSLVIAYPVFVGIVLFTAIRFVQDKRFQNMFDKGVSSI